MSSKLSLNKVLVVITNTITCISTETHPTAPEQIEIQNNKHFVARLLSSMQEKLEKQTSKKHVFVMS